MRDHVRARQALAAVAAGMVAVVALLLAPSTGWAQPGAQVNVSKARVYLGEQIEVTGSGFKFRDTVAVKVCGAPDASGRLACNKGVQDVRVTAAGRVNVDLKVTEPAGPCPCTVAIDSEDGPPVTTRIELVGYPVAKKVRIPEIVLDDVTVEKSSGIAHLFGMAPEPTLKLTLRNAGASPAQPTLDLAWSHGDDEPVAITDSGAPIIEPGEDVEFSLPVKFGAFAQGEHAIEGQIVVGDLVTPVETTTTVGPWGLYALAAVALVGGGVLRLRTSGAPVARSARSGSTSRSGSSSSRSGSSRSGSSRPSSSQSSSSRSGSSHPEPSRTGPSEPAPARSVPAPRKSSRRSGRSEPEYVGPPRLESTPITPLETPSPSLPRPAQPVAAPPTPVREPDTVPVPVASVEPSSPLGRLRASAPGASTLVEDAPAPAVSSAAPAAAPAVPRQQGNERAPAPDRDMARVAEALEAIKQRNEALPARLPDNESPAPVGRRAERGGKRAARPERGGWITRR